ncbi:hypothetical protein AB5J62_19365 [Amycolatopsis sp. cg5]
MGCPKCKKYMFLNKENVWICLRCGIGIPAEKKNVKRKGLLDGVSPQ